MCHIRSTANADGCISRDNWNVACTCRAKRGCLVCAILLFSMCHMTVFYVPYDCLICVTVLHAPYSLDSGRRRLQVVIQLEHRMHLPGVPL